MKHMTTQITLFIIARNEADKIAKCLSSAKDTVDEIVLVDDSTDDTAAIAKQFGARVYTHPFEGFTAQKNFALSQVKTPWALSLDADEVLTPELAQEIRQAVQNTAYDGFELTRVNCFLGQRMLHGGLKKEHILRLVRTEKARYEGGLVHEKLCVQGPTARLKNVFMHYSYNDIETYFEKFNKYTTLAAQTMYEKGKKRSFMAVLFIVPFEFLRRYVLKLGFLDGVRGFLWAAFSAFYIFVKYMKLWLLNTRGNNK